ncbi:MAG: hypothetical protein ABSG31_09775 [Tepidisphaeraceae bacterium]|jgi:uncharacterized membrane protein
MSGAPPEFNLLYHQWDLGKALSAIAITLIGGIWWLIKRDDSDVRTAVLEIKQAITTMFMQTVIDEARRLLALLDEHLPVALSQETVVQPQRSRFDRFCQSLRAINPEELEDRGKYSNIIRDAFSGVIMQTIDRLMEAAASKSRGVAGDLFNPTAIRFEMEGLLHLKFAFVSNTSAQAFARQRRYFRSHNAAVVSFLVASVCIFLLWFPLFVDARWAWYMCVTTLLATAFSAAVGLIAVVRAHFCQRWLEHKALAYRQKSGLLVEYSEWTKDYGV